ncbi:hypothetical protein BDV96DRAFT_681504 [Lophiotrema nucula]|uniref:Uncharacterized protein n=1 Tax=Lophiotrema nucula TaxID=690887 RepID=A0A6A5ZVU6_9PLEO|nr:hypothetical protein BDV96DRAFT_681504 [Lophiotrema nucula]
MASSMTMELALKDEVRYCIMPRSCEHLKQNLAFHKDAIVYLHTTRSYETQPHTISGAFNFHSAIRLACKDFEAELRTKFDRDHSDKPPFLDDYLNGKNLDIAAGLYAIQLKLPGGHTFSVRLVLETNAEIAAILRKVNEPRPSLFVVYTGKASDWNSAKATHCTGSLQSKFDRTIRATFTNLEAANTELGSLNGKWVGLYMFPQFLVADSESDDGRKFTAWVKLDESRKESLTGHAQDVAGVLEIAAADVDDGAAGGAA